MNILCKVILIVIAMTMITSCKLWTIRPIDSKAKHTTAISQPFNADSYVASIWDSKIIPTGTEKATDLTALLNTLDANAEEAKKQFGIREGEGATHFIVKGEGIITRVNSDSPHRTLTIRLPKYSGKAEITIQIGPVFRGTSLRDAVGFIKFNEFTNQLQYAEVSTKLHERVANSVVKDLNPATMQGKPISFAGTFTLTEPAKIMLTPVKLALGGTAQ